jgi:type IV secretory pathway TraG/TraD family ATPase VirD4
LIDERITSDTFNNGWNNLISQIPVKVDISHIERPLMYPIEVMALSRDIQIVFFAGDANPILMDKNYYYKNSNYLLENSDSKYDNNPYFKEN